MSEIKEDTQPVGVGGTSTNLPPVDQDQPATEQPYYTYPGRIPPPPPRRSSGCGCWLIGLTTLLVVFGLVIAGLLLPPFNLADRLLGTQYAQLSSQSNAATANGLTLIVDPANPGEEFGVALGAVSMDAFLSSGTSEWLPAARAALQPYLALQSQVFNIETTGTAPETVTLTIELPPNSANPDVLDLYGWSSGASRWEFIPSHPGNGQILARVNEVPEHLAIFQASPRDPIVLAELDANHRLQGQAGSLVTVLAPVGMQVALPASDGSTLIGNPAPGFDTNAGYLVMPFIRNFSDPRATDPDTITAIINNRELRDAHIRELTSFTSAGGYDGVFIDYRDIAEDQRTAYTAFIRALAESLDAANLQLGVAVPQARNTDGTWVTEGYNWRAIGAAADYVQINFGLDPSTFTPGSDRLIEAMTRWAVGEVERSKLLAGLSALSVRQSGGGFTTVGFDAALSPLGDVQLELARDDGQPIPPGSEIRVGLDGFEALPGVDTTVQSPFIDYMGEDGAVASRIWLTTGEALRFRMDRFAPFGIAGVSFSDLLDDGVAENVLPAIVDYKVQLPSSASQTELVLNWRIEGSSGEITEFTTDFNADVVVTLAVPDGNYAVNVEVASGELSSARRGAQVAVFAPTNTPTPLPTSTPTPQPTATPTLAPIVPTVAPPAGAPAGGGVTAPVGNPNPAAPGSGSIGAFEYGGHVTSASSSSAVNAMRNAGMTWMKVQVRYGVGGGTEAAAEAINAARANGFKILLGVVGSPAELRAGGGDYINQFAAHLGAVAALGPDAIEVWNEPNLAREWPEGQISGANYTAMLSAAYRAIKAANSSVLVIAGAPSPTGAEAAFPGQVVNDDNFIRQMMDAGAINYMDCMGLHYNEGIVSPTQTSGDPRDNYYTRYLPTLLNTYWNLIGGQKPICITELGYLTPEGYGALSAFWSWGQNTTVAQQAAYLAQAAAYAAQSGRVRLMIVWNVDFTQFNANDPMGGYAIIRADGSCPACGALAGAR
ncbi:MAG: hypothetical protein OHK0046_31790 [Anaerolineae bacterium]